MVRATVVQLSGRGGWLLQLLLAVGILSQWCESQCTPPGGFSVVNIDWSLTGAQDGRLAARRESVCVVCSKLNEGVRR